MGENGATIAVYAKDTREILAIIPLNGGEAILLDGVDFQIFANGTEPVIEETDQGIRLKDNAFFMKM